jgi:hypothetical protein
VAPKPERGWVAAVKALFFVKSWVIKQPGTGFWEMVFDSTNA